MPATAITLYRLAVGGTITEEAFAPDWCLRQRFGFESWAAYMAFSAFDSREAAEAEMPNINQRRLGNGIVPYRQIASFEINRKLGHACAWDPPESGHVHVWAPPPDVASTAVALLPITGQEA
jgi:hypothetical protein